MTNATQGSPGRWLLIALAALAGCHAGPGTGPLPASPEGAVRSFLDAAQANNLTAMGDLWGSARGPARTYMDRQELQQRLTIMRTYLSHEKFELVPDNANPPPAADGRHVVQVRLTRKGCTPVVPFTLIPYGGGWLVTDVDLAKAGNPARNCQPPEDGRERPGADLR